MKTTREQHRLIARALLSGEEPKEIRERDDAKAAGVTLPQIYSIRKAFQAGGVGKMPLLTVPQGAVVLGVIPRRVRLLCQEGRLGTQVGGGPWIIHVDELIAYLGRDHGSGQAGREAAEEDKMAVEDRYGSLT